MSNFQQLCSTQTSFNRDGFVCICTLMIIFSSNAAVYFYKLSPMLVENGRLQYFVHTCIYLFFNTTVGALQYISCKFYCSISCVMGLDASVILTM